MKESASKMILQLLDRHPTGLSREELITIISKKLAIKPGSVVKALRRLEKKNLISLRGKKYILRQFNTDGISFPEQFRNFLMHNVCLTFNLEIKDRNINTEKLFYELTNYKQIYILPLCSINDNKLANFTVNLFPKVVIKSTKESLLRNNQLNLAIACSELPLNLRELALILSIIQQILEKYKIKIISYSIPSVEFNKDYESINISGGEFCLTLRDPLLSLYKIYAKSNCLREEIRPKNFDFTIAELLTAFNEDATLSAKLLALEKELRALQEEQTSHLAGMHKRMHFITEKLRQLHDTVYISNSETLVLSEQVTVYLNEVEIKKIN